MTARRSAQRRQSVPVGDQVLLRPGILRSRIATPIAIAIAFAAVPALAGPRLADVRGHLGLGYGKLLATSAAQQDPEQRPRVPGGSLAIGAGVDLPAAAGLRAGVEVGYMLLGTITQERGTLVAELDYSLFETLLLAHWSPPWRGPLGIVSIGPGVFNARADLTSSGGAEFADLPIAETRPGAAVGITLIQRSAAPVRIGLEVGYREVFLAGDRDGDGRRDTWRLGTARLAVHY
jgi:hypothetical protein